MPAALSLLASPNPFSGRCDIRLAEDQWKRFHSMFSMRAGGFLRGFPTARREAGPSARHRHGPVVSISYAPEASGAPSSSCVEVGFLGTIISKPVSARSRSAWLADLDLVLESPFIPPKG